MLTSKESRLNVRIPRELEDCRLIARKLRSPESERRTKQRFVIKLRNCPAVRKPSYARDQYLTNYDSNISENQAHFIQQVFESANKLQENIQMVLPRFKGANEVVISPHFKRSDKRLTAGADGKPKKRSFSLRRKKSLEELQENKISLLQEQITYLKNEIEEMKTKPAQDFSFQDVNQKVETLMKIVLDMKTSYDSGVKKDSASSQNLKNKAKSSIPIPPPPKSSTMSTVKSDTIPSMRSNVSIKVSKTFCRGSPNVNRSLLSQSKDDNQDPSQQKLKEKSSNIFKNMPKQKTNRSIPVKVSKEISENQNTISNKSSLLRLQSGKDSSLPTTNYAQFYQEISSSDMKCEGSHISNETNNCDSTVPTSDILKQITDISLKRDFKDIFLSILSYTSTSDFRVNVNEKSTGKMLGFFMVNEEAFQKSYKEGAFDKFLTLFILTPGQSNRKNMILNTFLLAK